MRRLERCALTLSLAVTLAAGFSCADDGDPKQGPTDEEMRQVASGFCEKEIGCGFIPGDVTLEECIANQVGAYQDSAECVTHYSFDECLATQTCEEIERLSQLNMGDCLDERDEADKVECDPF